MSEISFRGNFFKTILNTNCNRNPIIQIELPNETMKNCVVDAASLNVLGTKPVDLSIYM